MMLLAGLMGMALVGATVFLGFDGSEEDEDVFGAVVPPGDPDVGVILSGDSDDEAISGTDSADQINGYAGADTIDGGDGDDELHGWEGDDLVSGGRGADTVHGETGDDALRGDAGDDSLFGHSDSDTLSGGEGADTVYGGAGDDLLWGDEGDDALHGGLDNDTLIGGLGLDTLFGGWGDDLLDGREPSAAEQDYLNGGGGDDEVVAGGLDVVTSGTGADTIFIGDWIAEDEEAQITDFNVLEDRLIIVFDDALAGDDDPEIRLLTDALDPTVTHVQMNGELIAAVTSDMEIMLSDLSIMAESDAALLFGGLWASPAEAGVV